MSTGSLIPILVLLTSEPMNEPLTNDFQDLTDTLHNLKQCSSTFFVTVHP